MSNLLSMQLKLKLLILSLSLFLTSAAQAAPMKEFVMSCTYGVLAGTLVGAASLAFTSQPGENLHRVARGASLGLYAGIALGFYVVYGVSDDSENYEDPVVTLRKLPKIAVLPILNKEGEIDGARIQYKLRSF